TLEELEGARTRAVIVSLFHTSAERDGMLSSGMEQGLNQSHAALDKVLADMQAEATPRRAPELGVAKVAFTMYPITDADRARRFYEETLGLRVGVAGGQGGMHWIEYDLPGGGCLALTNATQNKPSDSAGAIVALEVQDLDHLMAHLKEQGVTFK